MNEIFGYKKNQPVMWFNRSQGKSNQLCLYCGAYVGIGAVTESNKEHLIGREFVPTNEFEKRNRFNFIFRACKICNDIKANIERHVSSATLYSSPARNASEEYDQLACRKAEKDFHPQKRGVLIKDSGDSFNMQGSLSGINFKFGMLTPPQLDEKFCRTLALRHIQGMYSLVCSGDPLTSDGIVRLEEKNFFFFGMYPYNDWGNSQLMSIADRVVDFTCCVNVTTPNGFFKIIMRRTSADSGEWFWALEWNKSYRLIGAITQLDAEPEMFRDLPELNWLYMKGNNGKETRVRKQTSIKMKSDLLFSGGNI